MRIDGILARSPSSELPPSKGAHHSLYLAHVWCIVRRQLRTPAPSLKPLSPPPSLLSLSCRYASGTRFVSAAFAQGPTIMPLSYCLVTRYAGWTSTQRVISSSGSDNWALGHQNPGDNGPYGTAGTAFMGGYQQYQWRGQQPPIMGSATDWLLQVLPPPFPRHLGCGLHASCCHRLVPSGNAAQARPNF